MLEVSIQRIIDRIYAVSTSHLRSANDSSMEATDWEFIFGDFDGWCVLHLSMMERGGYWVYPTLFPEAKLAELKDRLPDFDISPSSAAYSCVGSGSDQWIEPYWGESAFDDAEVELFFRRSHYGRHKGDEHYVEFNQLITHSMDLHWSASKKAYCRVDDHGQEAEKIKLIESDVLTLFLIRRRTLDAFLRLGKWVLVRYLDFQRWRSDHPPFPSEPAGIYQPTEYEGKFDIRKIGSKDLKYVEFRGAQIERPPATTDRKTEWPGDDEEDVKKYAEFIVYDFKNGRVLKDYRIAPSNFANYFTKSTLPYEMSPMFFKPEVLDKYKGDLDRFTLTERSIDCRGGWHLETFDHNEHRQVHTYAVYLSRLPYKEQLHWAQFNEERKGDISERAFRTDFEGSFAALPTSELFQLQKALEDLGAIRVIPAGRSIWSPKGGSWDAAATGLFLLTTENRAQWHDFIILSRTLLTKDSMFAASESNCRLWAACHPHRTGNLLGLLDC